MLTYASHIDWETDNPGTTPPATLDRLLRAATVLVADAVRYAVYSTGPDGYPTDPVVREALRQATLAQVTAWVASGVDPAHGAAAVGADGVVTSSRMLSASVTVETSPTAAADRAALVDSLTSHALMWLRAAGLLEVAPCRA